MTFLSQFKRLFRFEDWWLHKLGPALGLFLIFHGKSTEIWEADDVIRCLMVVVTISSAAMYTSFSNDLFDLESDRLAGKRIQIRILVPANAVNDEISPPALWRSFLR